MPSNGRSAKGAIRREQILQKAFDIIARDGYRSATLGAVARELGLVTPHIVYYFGTREELLKEVIQRWDASSIEGVAAAADSLEGFARAIRGNLTIRGIVHLYLAFATEAVDVDHPAHEFFRARFEQTFQALMDVIVDGQQAGLLRDDLDASLIARMLVALADGLQLQALLDPAVNAPADLDAAIDGFFVGGARQPIPGRSGEGSL